MPKIVDVYSEKSRPHRKSRAMFLSVQEPRCVGRDCDSRNECKRYTQLVYENLTVNARKGHSVAMSMVEDDGICRRKIDG